MLMNYLYILCCYFVSSICTFIGYKFLSPFIIRHTVEIGPTVKNSISLLTAGNKESYLFISVIVAVIIGIALSIIVGLEIISEIAELDSINAKLIFSLFSILLFVNAMASLYLLLFFVLIIFILGFFISGIYIYGSSKNGPVHVRGHFRNGRPVRSYFRRRPRRF
jgi:hypothetical protein